MGRVFVLGNAAVDTVLTLPRMPFIGETLVGQQAAPAPGGKGLNQAVVAARTGRGIGVDVFFLAPVGFDAAGNVVSAALAAEPFAGVDLPRLDHPTDMSLVMVLPDGDNSIVSAGACAAALPDDIAAGFAAAAAAGPGDVLLLQGNLSERATHAAIRAACAGEAMVMLNTAPLCWPPHGLLPDCDVVVANSGEARAISGETDPVAAAHWLHSAGVRLAVVTLGADGCVTAGLAGTRHWPARPVAALDTTGCGDTFCGVLATVLAAGFALHHAIEAAQRAAAITATRAGAYTALPAADELAVLVNAAAATDFHAMGIAS
jgi:ribokinase